MKKDKNNTGLEEKKINTESEESEEQDKKFFSDRKTVVRFIIFIIAFVTAVAFITYGVSQIGHKDEGLYEITCDNDDSVPLYFSGITFKYYFTGSSSEINSSMKFIKGVYSESLKLNYKLLDPVNTYEGVKNIAYINQHPGEDIIVSEELFEVLSDAYEKTCANKGYDMFSGIAARLRDQTVYAEDRADNDYYEDDALREIMSLLRTVSEKQDSVVFKLDEKKRSVYLDLSDEYKSFLNEYDPDGAVMDLDLLHDSYMLKYVVRALEKEGYNEGYITTSDGLSILLSGMGEVDFCLYTNKTGSKEAVISAEVEGKGGQAASSFRAFALYDSELGYYIYEKDGKKLYRNKYISDFEKETGVLSSVSVSDEYNPVEAVYSNIAVFNSADADSAAIAAAGSGCRAVLYELNEDEKIVYSTADDVSINSVNGYKSVRIE